MHNSHTSSDAIHSHDANDASTAIDSSNAIDGGNAGTVSHDPSPSPAIAWAQYDSQTDRGQVREQNEDRVFVQPWPDGSALLAVVADGMGGHRGGEVAAQIAIETLAELLQTALPADNAQRYELLARALREGDRRIRERACTSFKLMDMGATLVAAIATPSEYLYLHAGDCRLYHFRADGEPVRRSKDHSVVQVLLDLGHITEAQIPNHPMRSVVNSCLGGRGDKPMDIDPQWQEDDPPIYPWQAGDVLLLSSDGLHGALSGEQLQGLVATHGQRPTDLVQACIEAANAAGGKDNISIVAIARPVREK